MHVCRVVVFNALSAQAACMISPAGQSVHTADSKHRADKRADSKHRADKRTDSKHGADKRADSKHRADKSADSKHGADKSADSKHRADKRAEQYCLLYGQCVPASCCLGLGIRRDVSAALGVVERGEGGK